jgi:transposase
MDPILFLDRPTRRRVKKLGQKTRDALQLVRCRVILKVNEGMSRRAAAMQIGCAPSTAWCIVKRFKAFGEASLWDGRCENGGRKVDEDVLRHIEEILDRGPEAFGFGRPTWTLEMLARVIAEEVGIALSVGHLWKVLRELKARWGRPRPVVACPWTERRRRRRIRRLRRLAKTLGRDEVLVYADEVDIHLNPKIGFDWMLPGRQRIVVTPGKNEKRYIAAAYDPAHQRLTYVEGDRKASWLFLNLLRALQQAYRGIHKIHVILDNYVIHKSHLVRMTLKRLTGIALHFLPPYCPNENRIEREWQDFHANVTRNHRCRSIRELMEATRAYLGARYQTYRGLSIGC